MSQPIPLRLNLVATRKVVPLPSIGSSTVHGTCGAPHLQVGCQPVVVLLLIQPGLRPSFWRLLPCDLLSAIASLASITNVFADFAVGTSSVSTTRVHGALHFAQAPSALVPSRMHGSTNFSGKVAKWAAERLWVGMVQTFLRLACEREALRCSSVSFLSGAVPTQFHCRDRRYLHRFGIVEVIMPHPEIDALPVVSVPPAGRLDRCLFFQVAVPVQPVYFIPQSIDVIRFALNPHPWECSMRPK